MVQMSVEEVTCKVVRLLLHPWGSNMHGSVGITCNKIAFLEVTQAACSPTKPTEGVIWKTVGLSHMASTIHAKIQLLSKNTTYNNTSLQGEHKSIAPRICQSMHPSMRMTEARKRTERTRYAWRVKAQRLQSGAAEIAWIGAWGSADLMLKQEQHSGQQSPEDGQLLEDGNWVSRKLETGAIRMLEEAAYVRTTEGWGTIMTSYYDPP